jgi:heme exporter protein CcmD
VNHAPFIWSAYIIATVILTWCAVAPLFRQRKALNAARTEVKRKEAMHDANT